VKCWLLKEFSITCCMNLNHCGGFRDYRRYRLNNLCLRTSLLPVLNGQTLPFMMYCIFSGRGIVHGTVQEMCLQNYILELKACRIHLPSESLAQFQRKMSIETMNLAKN